MVTFALFILSGTIIAVLAIAKRMEEKRRQTPLVLRAVSHGDERIRKFHHEALFQYSQAKDKSAFYLKKQLPLKLKSLINKLNAYAKEKGVEYFGDMRGARLLKKPDGISEFFKNISEIEKGTGEINESLPPELQEDFQVETAEKPIEVTETRVETIVSTDIEEKPVHLVTELEPAPAAATAKPKRKRAYRPRVRKLAVLEVAE